MTWRSGPDSLDGLTTLLPPLKDPLDRPHPKSAACAGRCSRFRLRYA